MSNIEPEIIDIGEFLSEFNKENDRGAALVAISFLNERIEQILVNYLANAKSTIELFNGYNAPLGTFGSKVKLAYSLGLITHDEYEEIDTIRKIRNEFGHSWRNVGFNTSPISELCSNLSWRGPQEYESNSAPRERFNASVAMLVVDLLWRVRLVKKEQRTIRDWPNKTR